MKSMAQKLILISFILALITAAIVFLYLKSLKSSNGMTRTNILVAAETIPSGTLIEKKMIKEIQVPNDSIFSDYIKDSSKVIGKYTKESISQNEGFRSDKLLDKNGNELNLKIESGYRAISVSVTGDSGVSNLLKPGDYVDIIVYASEKKDGTKIVRPDVAKIILQNIEILAVDKQLNRDTKANDRVSDKTNDKTSDSGKTQANFLVTLSVKASDLEKVVLAQSIGSIKLALRALKDDNTIETNGTTWENLSVNVDSYNQTDNINGNNSSDMSSSDNNTEKYKNYTVNSGDTLKSISMKFYGDESKYTIIKEANNIQDEDLILTGEIIKIPMLQQ